MKISVGSSRLLFPLLFVLFCLCLLWQILPKTKSAAQTNETEAVNYDIRTDKSELAAQTLTKFIEQAGKSSALIETDRKKAVQAENELRSRIAELKIEYDADLQTPEVIATDVKSRSAFLTSASKAERADIFKNFLKENLALIGLSGAQIDALKTTADYTNPDGNLSFVHLEQIINGIPVFQGEIKGGFTKKNEIIRIINNLAPQLNYETLANDFGDSVNAIENASKHITTAPIIEQPTAEKFYFPLDYGVALAAWRVFLQTKTDAFYVVVDGRNGTLLWRKNLTESQTQPATYEIYGNLTSIMKTADSPSPFSPGCPAPTNCPQPLSITRQSFTLIGNEPPYTFNNNGWINDGENRTIGNAAEAGIDRDGTNGIDPNGWAFGSPSRNFVYVYNPGPGIPPPGEEPVPTMQTYPPSSFQQGSVTHVFYTANRWHDETYLLGFTEQARNFQTNNFGRGGAENDRFIIEVQDSSGTNGANTTTTADGTSSRSQTFIWTGATPDRDGALDSQAVVHELTHGLSNRLHGNALGLGSNMSRGMGEGWSDFYAFAMLSEPSDNPSGTHALAGYITHLAVGSSFESNYYYGIRRFPTARITALGPNGLPFNPITFRYLNSNCNTLIGTTTTNPNSAYPRNPIFGAPGTPCDQIHNAGEIWSAALWEVRGFLIEAHGATEGNRRALQYITDGMKISPLNPTMLQSRDAVLIAAQASNASDVRHVWRGFAARGMGIGASIQNAGTGANNTVVTESFDTPNVVIGNNFSVSDTTGNNNGYPEPGEQVILTIPLVNNSGETVSGVNLAAVGGGSAFYGDIANGQTVSRTVLYTIPNANTCGANFQFTFNITGSLGPVSYNRSILVGVPNTLFTENFDTVAAPVLPAEWTVQQTGAGVNWVTATGSPDTTPNSAFVPNPAAAGGADLTSPGILITAITVPSAILEFRNNFNTDSGWDGGVVEISIGNGAFQDIIAAGGSFLSGGYTAQLRGTGNPLLNRQGWTGNSNGYITTKIQLPTTAVGQNVRFRWRMGHDQTVGGSGWQIDSVKIYSFVCPDLPSLGKRADFDGDGRTDLSVFRPSEGIWYLNRSTAGFTALNWGISSDRLTPGDFDGDGKTDPAVFRPNSDGNQPDFYVLNSSNSTYSGYSWGLPDDVPVIEDYDGDGQSDIAVFRPSNHTFYVRNSSDASVRTFANISFGTPVAGDFDGDGKGDFASYTGSGWYLAPSNINYATVNFTQFGSPGDKPVPADYDGDGRSDFAVFRPADQTWYIRKSSGGIDFVQFGLAADRLVPGDYDGDGKADVAVYRDGVWYVNRSTAGLLITQFGLAGDTPVPQSYLP